MNEKFIKKKTPRIGGIYLTINLTIFLLFVSLIEIKKVPFVINFENNLFFFIGFYLVFFLGLLDDKYHLKANNKLFVFVLIFSLITIFNDGIVLNKLVFKNFDFSINLGKLSYIFTVLCFIIFINAFNMFDGINCQSTIYSIVFLSILFFLHDLNVNLILVIIIALLNILVLNYKDKIFLGDSGSLTLGYIISYLVINHYNSSESKIYADEIFLLMIYPGIDMLRLFILRIFNKKNPLQADKLHMHHYLIEKFSFKKSISISIFIFSFPLFLYYFLNLNYMTIIIYFFLIYLSILFFLRFRKI